MRQIHFSPQEFTPHVRTPPGCACDFCPAEPSWRLVGASGHQHSIEVMGPSHWPWFSSPQLWSERSWKIGMLIVVGILTSRYFLWWSYLGSHVQVKFSRMATSVANCRWGRSHSSLGVGILRPYKSARTGEGTTVKIWWLRLMVQKSTHHQLRLVVYPMISTVFDTSQVVQGFIYPWKTKNGAQ